MMKPIHPGRLNKVDLGGNAAQLEPWAHVEKRLLP